jgi:hypothetical protein
MNTRNESLPPTSARPRLPLLLSVIQAAIDQRRLPRPTLSLAAEIRLQREARQTFTMISQQNNGKTESR